ncbi:MAG: hypothetical protein IKC65_04775 [Lentisphaeria bacterium]|nr:hypothetical protein [Lentisphaeria bacterium]
MNEMAKLKAEHDQLRKEFTRLAEEAVRKNLHPYEDKFASPEYLALMSDTSSRAEEMLKRYYELDLALKGPEHFSRENVFVWGGPTPRWGGSMAKDASLKAKEFFGVDNVMYVYGPHNDEMFALHKDCRKLLCHLGRNCRTEGAQSTSDAEEAENLSKYSLRYPNIIGGVVDDMTGNYGKNYSLREYRAIHEALHKHNPDLNLYGVVYSWELDMKRELTAVSECIDHVILWFWWKTDLMELDLALEKCRALFPGKPIMLGIFMFDYGAACLPNSAATMNYHLEKARRHLAAGKIQDIVILGDREIEKCPEAAEAVKNFIQSEFAKSEAQA